MPADNPRGEGNGSGDAGRGDDGAVSERLMRIEESVAFGEHAIENLTAQMLDLDAKFRRLSQRLEAIEGRLRRLDSPAEGEEPIP